MPTGAAKTTLQLHSAQPLYKQVAGEILQCLANGEWKPGDRLPTEPELARRFGVAVFTIRAGISELVATGILIRKQGKGTFVTRYERSHLRSRFARLFDSAGNRATPIREQVMSFTRQRADERTMTLLRLDRRPAPYVYCYESILRDETRPIGIRKGTVPAHRFPGLTADGIRNHPGSVYVLYQDVCGVYVIWTEERVRAARADKREARLLDIRLNAPVLQVERIAYTYNDVPVELRASVYDGSRYHYYFTLQGA